MCRTSCWEKRDHSPQHCCRTQGWVLPPTRSLWFWQHCIIFTQILISFSSFLLFCSGLLSQISNNALFCEGKTAIYRTGSGSASFFSNGYIGAIQGGISLSAPPPPRSPPPYLISILYLYLLPAPLLCNIGFIYILSSSLFWYIYNQLAIYRATKLLSKIYLSLDWRRRSGLQLHVSFLLYSTYHLHPSLYLLLSSFFSAL